MPTAFDRIDPAFIRETLLAWPASERNQYISTLSDLEATALLYNWDVWKRVDQTVPPDVMANGNAWSTCVALAGRGWGKTRVGAEWVKQQARTAFTRIALIGRIPKDVRNVMVEGESGLLAVSPPDFYPHWNSSLGILTWPNGSRAYTYSSEVPDDLRGPQFHKAWVDEWAKFRWPDDVWTQLLISRRLGRRPQTLVTTTPRPLKVLRKVLADERTVVIGGPTRANSENLPDGYMEMLLASFGGTSLSAQELDARILDDAEGALWVRALFDENRWQDRRSRPECVKTVLAIDPSVTSTETSDDTGMVLCGIDDNKHGYVLEDYTKPGGFDKHATFAVRCWRDGLCDLIVAETNNGGDLVEATLRAVRDPATGEQIGLHVPFKKVVATRGKRTRAEPVSLIYQQKRIHHVGLLAELEDECCQWVPDAGMASPNRLDALVWGFTELLLDPSAAPNIRRIGG